jgi:hypothetical protein
MSLYRMQQPRLNQSVDDDIIVSKSIQDTIRFVLLN